MYVKYMHVLTHAVGISPAGILLDIDANFDGSLLSVKSSRLKSDTKLIFKKVSVK